MQRRPRPPDGVGGWGRRAGGIECTFLLAEVSRLPGSPPPPPPPPSSPPTRRSHTKRRRRRRRLCPARRHCARVRDVGSPARTCDGRAPPLPRPFRAPQSVGPHARERVSKRVSSTCSLARSLLGVAEAAGGNGRGRSSDSHSNSRLSSNLGRVTLAERGSIAHKYRGGHGDDGEGSVGVGSVGPSFGRSVGERGRKEKSSSVRVPSARASVRRPAI